ncbi:MAG: SusC/RagA family TonB-linked outer membrane protein, partial [Daejeonella sp.]
KNVKYFVNAGHLSQGGQFNIEKGLKYDPSFFMKRYNFRSNIDIQLNKTLKAFLNVAGYLEKQNSPFSVNGSNPSVYILASIFNRPATVPGPLTPDGQAVTTDYGGNPPAYALINRTGYKQNTRSNITASYGMEQELDFITKGLSVKAILSFDSRSVNDLYASKNYAASVQVVDSTQRGADGKDSVYFRPLNNNKDTPLNLYNGFSFTTFTNTQAFLNYNRTFSNKHAVSGLVLYQQQQTIIGAQLPFNLRGFATRITYGYDNRYFAEFNAGYNGSEQFAKGRRFGFFPAVSAGWVVSNEKFLANSKAITQLKLRGSYGKVGNDRISGLRFLYLDNIQVVGGGYSGSLNFGQRISENLLKNEQLQWEVATKYNIGFDLGLFRDFNLVIDVYSEKRDNVLRLRGTVPALNGLPTNILPPVNIGVIENKGYEVEFNYKKAINRNFSLFSKINFNYSRNKQIYADEPLLPDDYTYRYRQTGFKIGQQFGYIVEGYFQDQADINKSPVQNVPGHGSRPGDFKYRDQNKDGFINERDQVPIGYSAVPEYTYGAAFGVTYKGLDISVLIQGIKNVTNFYSNDGVFETLNFVERHKQSWTPDRVASGAAINYPRLTGQTSPNNIQNSFFLMDGSYLRLKNMEIGYTIPGSWSKKIGSNRIRFYANGFNLLTWDKLPTKDFDPEVLSANAYPLTRLHNFGVNIVF